MERTKAPNWTALACISFTLLGCGSFQTGSDGNWRGYTASGKASFYSSKHQGKKTASGELYNQNLKTAAHKTLPFGTVVKVTNEDNAKSVIVKINDRGPYIRGRIIDLSHSAFASIGAISQGVIDVNIEVV